MTKDLKIVAMIQTLNEEDIIKETLEHLFSQGLEVVVLDNDSSDKTYKICEKYLGNGVLDLFQLKSSEWEHGFNLQTLYQMALRQKPDWFILNDADELLESGTKNSLKEEIIKVDNEGFNLIQFNGFSFYMTDNDMPDAELIKRRLSYYSHTGDGIFRAWKYYPGIIIEGKGGHVPIFPDGKRYEIYPQKFILRHYRFRSPEQAKQKMNERLERRSKTELQMNWHTHLDVIAKQDFSKKINHNLLTKYEEDNSWNCEVKYRPFSPPNTSIKTKQEWFSEDGFLKKRPPKYSELRALVKKQREKIEKFKKILQNKNSTKGSS